MAAPLVPNLALFAFFALLLWRGWARYKRMVGRQRLSRIRPWVTLAIFPLIVLLVALATRTHPERLWFLAGGLAAGAALSVYGLRTTTFEPTKQGLFYTPNRHLGLALSVLFLARVAWRVVEIQRSVEEAASGAQGFVRSPLTLVAFGLLAGYFMGYAAGLARWRLGVMRRKREREAREALAAAQAPADPPLPPAERDGP